MESIRICIRESQLQRYELRSKARRRIVHSIYELRRIVARSLHGFKKCRGATTKSPTTFQRPSCGDCLSKVKHYGRSEQLDLVAFVTATGYLIPTSCHSNLMVRLRVSLTSTINFDVRERHLTTTTVMFHTFILYTIFSL